MAIHSWQLVKEARNRILVVVITPSDPVVSMNFSASMRNIQLPPGSDWMQVQGLPFDAARNQGFKLAFERGMHLAYLDTDLRIPPDTFIRLLETQLPYVSGLYFQKFPPHMPVMFTAMRDGAGLIQRAPVTGWKPGDIVPCTFVPTGMLLIRNELLGPIIQRHPRPFQWAVDIAPVLDYGGNPLPSFSEDFTLSFRVLQMGIQPMCHTGIVGLHEIRGAVVGPRWLIPYPSSDPYHGVVGVV